MDWSARRVSRTALAIAIAAAFAALEPCTKYLLERLPGKAKYLVSEFPHVNESRFRGYNSFDPELGWVRQPNERREMTVANRHPNNDPDTDPISLTTDRYGSRVCEIDRGEGEFDVATYGDSYCFGWEVNDDETLQHHLSRKLGVHVSNYGVGNYGIDQGFLRLRRRFEDDPADYVVLAVCDKYAIERICSVWLHYVQFDNPLAVKPRLRIEDGDLRTVPVPIEEKEGLLTLDDHAAFLRAHDYHHDYFRNWFTRHRVSVPYSSYWLRSRYNLPHATAVVLSRLTRERIDPLHDALEPLRSALQERNADQYEERYSIAPAEQWAYRDWLVEEFADLFCAELRAFSTFVRSHGSTPIFLPLGHNDRFYRECAGKGIDEPLLERVRETCPGLHVVDARDEVASEVEEIDTLYVRKGSPGGHLSPTGNERYAAHLSEFIRDHRRESDRSSTGDEVPAEE